jgi:hypothetical protein
MILDFFYEKYIFFSYGKSFFFRSQHIPNKWTDILIFLLKREKQIKQENGKEWFCVIK